MQQPWWDLAARQVETGALKPGIMLLLELFPKAHCRINDVLIRAICLSALLQTAYYLNLLRKRHFQASFF
jgi:hypothetical protein